MQRRRQRDSERGDNACLPTYPRYLASVFVLPGRPTIGMGMGMGDECDMHTLHRLIIAVCKLQLLAAGSIGGSGD